MHLEGVRMEENDATPTQISWPRRHVIHRSTLTMPRAAERITA